MVEPAWLVDMMLSSQSWTLIQLKTAIGKDPSTGCLKDPIDENLPAHRRNRTIHHGTTGAVTLVSIRYQSPPISSRECGKGCSPASQTSCGILSGRKRADRGRRADQEHRHLLVRSAMLFFGAAESRALRQRGHPKKNCLSHRVWKNQHQYSQSELSDLADGPRRRLQIAKLPAPTTIAQRSSKFLYTSQIPQ